MARSERAYAESVAEKNNTSLDEAGIEEHFLEEFLVQDLAVTELPEPGADYLKILD